MIIGVGIDIADRKRFARADEKLGDRFFEKIFLPDEIVESRSLEDAYRAFAERFAAKEAVLKALGYGLDKGASFKEIEIVESFQGKAILHGNARRIAKDLGITDVLLTISREDDLAIAVAVLEHN